MSEEVAPASRIIGAAMSALWLIGGGLLLLFFAMVGTLSCGVICDQLMLVLIVVALAMIAVLVLALRLLWGAVRRRLSDRLMKLAVWADMALLLLLIGAAALLSGT